MRPSAPNGNGSEKRRIEAAASGWSRSRGLPVDPVPFLQTLRQLGSVTQDRRFIKYAGYLMTGSDLIDPATEKWSLHNTKLARFLPELIEEAIAAGVTTERQAIAEAVAKFGRLPRRTELRCRVEAP